MNSKESKEIASSIMETAETHLAVRADATNSISSAANNAGSITKLYKSGNKSLLIKAGIALIAFPEPVVSDVLGTTLLAAGAIQEGIRRQSIYLDDLPKALKSAMRDLKSARDLL